MGKLIKFEFAKLLKAKVFYICLGISIAMVILLGCITTKDEFGPNSLTFFKSFTQMSFITTVICIPVSVFVCEDAQCGAEKTVLGRGITRTKFFFAKYISSLVGYMVFVLLTMAVTYVFGVIKFDYVVDNTLVPFIFLVILGLFMFHGLFFSVATITGKNGIAIAISIMVPTILQLLVLVLDYFIDIKDFSFAVFSFSDILNTLVRYSSWNKDITWAVVLAAAYPCTLIGIAHEVYIRKEN